MIEKNVVENLVLERVRVGEVVWRKVIEVYGVIIQKVEVEKVVLGIMIIVCLRDVMDYVIENMGMKKSCIIFIKDLKGYFFFLGGLLS